MKTETSVATCASCGCTVDPGSEECESCRRKRNRPASRARSVIIAVCTLAGIAIVVVAGWIICTIVPLALHGSTGGPTPQSHLQASAQLDQGSAASGLDSSMAYAVADVEGNSQKDRDTLNGKTFSVTGYVVGSRSGGAVIADTPSAGDGSARLNIKVAQPLEKGSKARFTGVYDAASNTLAATATHAVR